jgi:hyperosmotically inducible protein
MKRHLVIALSIIFTALGSLTATAVTEPINQQISAEQLSTRQAERRSTSQTSQDRVRASLAREVRHELLMLPYYSVFDWLQYEVKGDGDVILQGQVTRPTLKSDAENVVKRIEGVNNVTNQIEVLPLSPNDDRIRLAVYRTLFNFNSPLHRYGLGAVPSIHIIVKNGNVTLKGVVSSEGDKNLANVRANGVSGVFSVKNELTVANGSKS